LCGEMKWIPMKEAYKIEYEDEKNDLNEEEKKTYENERQLCIKSTTLQTKMQTLTSQAK